MTAAPPSEGAVTKRATGRLRPHPFNAEVYGDDGAQDADLRISIRTHGVLVPLVVLPDGRIVSGHRRWAAAQAEGLADLPTRPYPGDPDDETEIKAAILEHNRQREKTPEQVAREVAAMLEIEQERGRRRQQEAGRYYGEAHPKREVGAADAPTSQKNGRAPKSSAIVGDLLGMSSRQVEMAASVIKTMDDLVGAGDYRGAEQVRRTLNMAGVGPAYKEVRRARGQSAGPIRAPGAPPRDRGKRNAIPHDPVRAGEVIRKNFSRDFAMALLGELQRLLREPW